MTTQSGPPGDEKSLGQLVSDLSEQGARLVRAEIDLAKAEITGRAQQLGVGAGLIIGVALLLIGAGVAAWAKRHLPPGPSVSVVRIHEPVHPAEEQVHPWAD